jgi:hypothetical protein
MGNISFIAAQAGIQKKPLSLDGRGRVRGK